MKNNFSLSRFATYSMAEIGSIRHKFLIDMLVMSGVIIFIYLISCFSWGNNNFAMTIGSRFNTAHIIALCYSSVVAIVYISQGFLQFHKPLTSVFAMTIPASKAEKFTFAAIFYLIVIGAIISMIDYVLYAIFASAFDVSDAQCWPKGLGVGYSWSNIPLYLAIMFFYLFCSVFFRRRQFIYTMASFLVVILICGIITVILMISSQASSAYQWSVTVEPLLTYLICPILAIGLLYLSWYKFKKIQKR